MRVPRWSELRADLWGSRSFPIGNGPSRSTVEDATP